MSFAPKERLIIGELIELVKELALRANGGDCPASHDPEYCSKVIGDCVEDEPDYCWQKYIESVIEKKQEDWK